MKDNDEIARLLRQVQLDIERVQTDLARVEDVAARLLEVATLLQTLRRWLYVAVFFFGMWAAHTLARAWGG